MTGEHTQDAALAAEACRAFGLGTLRREPTPVTGGLTHRIWRCETERGAYAVKAITVDPEGTWRQAWIERAFVLEVAAYDAGLPLPRPVPHPEGGCLAEAREADKTTLLRAHEWVEGEGLRRIVYPPGVAARTAGVVARIHALGVGGEPGRDDVLRVFGEAHWLALAERVERTALPWRWEFRAIVPTLVELERYVEAARSNANGPLIMGHRDADQKNWMQAPGGDLFLVDWDAAGPVYARHEAASLALTWAGVHLGEPDWNVVRAWSAGYTDAGGEDWGFRQGDLGEFIAVMIGWFEFNARRALRIADASSAETERIVLRLLKDLRRFERSIERWERALAQV